MAQISKRKLKGEVKTQIEQRLSSIVARIASDKEASSMLDDILTQTEQTMIAKRLSALLLLAEGLSSYRVSRLLLMSPETTARLMRELRKGKHPHIISLSRKKKARKDVWADLEVIVRLGMPEMGKNRWDWLNKI